MFIGRKKELWLLGDMIQCGRSAIGVIYGRRRIGKSELIKKAFEKERILVFEGLENRPKQEQLDNFLFQLAFQTGKERLPHRISSWREAFALLYKELERAPAHVVFDEFQWMANYRREIVSELKPVWDNYISTIKGTVLILCGSIASFMTTAVVKSNALYGRTDLVIHLKGFHLPETGKLLAGKGVREIIEAQMLVGGVPGYLELIGEKSSVRLAMEELAFTETGYLTDEYGRIFLSHFGKNPEYEKIVATLAGRPYGLFRKQIAELAGIEPGGGLTTHLQNLESAGFISSMTPFHKGHNSRLLKYFLSDPYLRFYYGFILPNLKKIKSGLHRDIFNRLTQDGAFHAWMGRSFEYLCLDHAGAVSRILGFSGIDFSVGPYFTAPKEGVPGVQIDLLFARSDNVINLCEMKYSVNQVGLAVIAEVEKKAAALANVSSGKTIQKILISSSGATRDLQSSGYFFRIIDPVKFFE